MLGGGCLTWGHSFVTLIRAGVSETDFRQGSTWLCVVQLGGIRRVLKWLAPVTTILQQVWSWGEVASVMPQGKLTIPPTCAGCSMSYAACISTEFHLLDAACKAPRDSSLWSGQRSTIHLRSHSREGEVG